MESVSKVDSCRTEPTWAVKITSSRDTDEKLVWHFMIISGCVILIAICQPSRMSHSEFDKITILWFIYAMSSFPPKKWSMLPSTLQFISISLLFLWRDRKQNCVLGKALNGAGFYDPYGYLPPIRDILSFCEMRGNWPSPGLLWRSGNK